jgi:lysyl-tRNA synthetase class II
MSGHDAIDACMQGRQVAVAGRVMARRFMGKLAFLALTDDSGSIQIYLDKAIIDAAQPEAFKCACPACMPPSSNASPHMLRSAATGDMLQVPLFATQGSIWPSCMR